MPYPAPLEALIEQLRVLPGVGRRSAERMAFQLLERDRPQAQALAEGLLNALEKISNCEQCHTLTEETVCEICSDPGRDGAALCIVASPTDQWALEATGTFRGRYFVLHGQLSPIDGVTPEDLAIPALVERLQHHPVEEVIVATNATVEGEATAHYLAEVLRPLGVRVTRLAQGVPLGGELELVDGGTLGRAFAGRTAL